MGAKAPAALSTTQHKTIASATGPSGRRGGRGFVSSLRYPRLLLFPEPASLGMHHVVLCSYTQYQVSYKARYLGLGQHI